MALACQKVACRTQARAGVARQHSVSCKASMNAARLAAATTLASGLLASPVWANGVQFANLKSGATVESPVTVDMLVDGLSVKPASEGLIPGTGHFHVIVDAPAPEEGDVIPFDDAHKHYGKGQTSAALELAPGKHTLTLQFANAKHESYGPTFANSVTVTVK